MKNEKNYIRFDEVNILIALFKLNIMLLRDF